MSINNNLKESFLKRPASNKQICTQLLYRGTCNYQEEYSHIGRECPYAHSLEIAIAANTTENF